MAVKFEYPPGATPLDPDDAAGLIPSHIAIQGQLNAWEFQSHARLMTDILLTVNGAEPFDWGNSDLVAPGEVRNRYIAALREADGRDHSPLHEFVRSGRASS